MEKKENPKYMLIYKCNACNQESGWTEIDNSPFCRYCESKDNLELIDKKEITLDVITERLKAVSDNMMKNLQLAYENLDEKAISSENVEFDLEKEMLLLMEKAKQLKDKVQNLDLSENSNDAKT